MKVQVLMDAGIDYDDGLIRFMGFKDIYENFIIEFPNDLSFQLALDSFKQKNYEQMFFNLHALKGVAGNLSLKRLYKIIYEVVELLRFKKYAEVEVPFNLLIKEYQVVIDAINISIGE